jgi:hypothetical protein
MRNVIIVGKWEGFARHPRINSSTGKSEEPECFGDIEVKEPYGR